MEPNLKNNLFMLIFVVIPAAVGVGGTGFLISHGVNNGLEILPDFLVLLGFMVYCVIPWDAGEWWDRKWEEWNARS